LLLKGARRAAKDVEGRLTVVDLVWRPIELHLVAEVFPPAVEV
jgi:hypothetical protein